MNRPTWRSFYVSPVDEAPDRLIGEHLRQVLSEIDGVIERSFFIRYWEGDLQLRLRVRTTEDQAEACVRPALDRMAARYADETGEATRVSEKRYDRTEHYFGETMDTVYAELLNEQTSAMALTALAGEPSRAAVYLGLLGLLDHLVRGAFGPEAPDAFRRSIAFAESAGAGEDPLPSAPLDRLWPVAKKASARLCQMPATDRVVRLLGRVARHADPFVGTHALHLLCNKLGVVLPAERHLFMTLAHIDGLPAGAGSGDSGRG